VSELKNTADYKNPLGPAYLITEKATFVLISDRGGMEPKG